MNGPFVPNSCLELRDPTGALVGFVISVAELNQLVAERDWLKRQVDILIPKATPEQEEAFRRELESTEWLDASEVIAEMIVDMERRQGDQ